MLLGAREFTVLLKNVVVFPDIDDTPFNNFPRLTNNSKYLQNCTYDAETDPLCPVFVLDDIANATGNNFTELAILGAVIEIEISWNCDLDYARSYCKPAYSFRRLDTKDLEALGSGYNFRYPLYFTGPDGIVHRNLTKAYGMLFITRVTGSGGQFRVLPLAISFGATIGLLAVATFICDLIILQVHKVG